MDFALQWRHNERDGVSNHQPHDCLLNGLFRHRSKKTSMFRVTGLCDGNSPVTGEFPSQTASNAENVSIWYVTMVSQKPVPMWNCVFFFGVSPNSLGNEQLICWWFETLICHVIVMKRKPIDNNISWYQSCCLDCLDTCVKWMHSLMPPQQHLTNI